MATYASATDLVARYDIEVVGQLATDDRVRLLRDDILVHPNVAIALTDACGEFDVRVRCGNRYTALDLADLDPFSLSHLKRIICVIAMSFLFRRRPGVHAEMAKAVREEADEWLRRLSTGEDVFGLNASAAHREAGQPALSGITSAQIVNRNFLANRMANRCMPSVAERQPLDRG
jgi:phage gp36-like protein